MDAFLFWTAAVLMTAIATLAVLWPLLRRGAPAAPTRAEHDAEVYGAQLAELKADLERGTMPAEEAETARAEIGRRLLKAAAEAKRDAGAGRGAGLAADRRASRGAGRAALVASFVFVAAAVPLGSLAAYVAFGSPDIPDLPLTARLAVDPAEADLPTLVAQTEARLRANPNDGAGWDRLAPVYLRSGRADEAAIAFGNAVRLLGDTPGRLTGLGEALTQASAGEVTEAAKASFERALSLNPDYLPARFFLALDLSQESRFAEAAPAWQALIGASPEGAPWLQLAELALRDAKAKLSGAGGPPPAGAVAGEPSPRGPSGEDIAAASDLSGAERSAMIEGMVSQLAARLKSAPNDVEGWKRLMRSYSVLGDGARARAALSDAAAVFAAGTPERGEIESFARGLGLTDAMTDGTQ